VTLVKVVTQNRNSVELIEICVPLFIAPSSSMIPGRKGKDKKGDKEKEKENKKQLRDEEKRREKEQQVESKKTGSSQSHHVPSSTTEPTSTHTHNKSHQIARLDTTYIRSFRKGYVEMRYRNSWKYIYVIVIGGSFHMYHNSTVCLIDSFLL
jgi:hypothetical protein